MKLQALIDDLDKYPDDRLVLLELVGLENQKAVITGINSYRGYYEDLALGYDPGGASRHGFTVGDLKECLQSAIAGMFQGFKGGTYQMDGHTKVWTANYGDATGWAPCEVVDDGNYVLIRAFDIERF